MSKSVLMILILLVATIANAKPMMNRDVAIRYSAVVDTVNWGNLDLTLSFVATEENQEVALPRWMPGAWMVADYARHLTGMSARDTSGQELPLEQLTSNRWRIQCEPGTSIVLSYKHVSSPRGFMGRKLTEQGGTLFGAPVFLFVEGQLDQPLSIELQLPASWGRIHTGLEPDWLSSVARMYLAEDYHQLVDSPFLLGETDSRDFQVGDRWVSIVLPTTGDFDRDGFQSMVQKIVEEEIRFFGGAPFERYLFFFHYTRGNSGGGGLEHRNSTSIGLPLAVLQEDMKKTAPIIAHELFHAWNMKNFYPVGFGSFEYEEPLRTSAFWLGEGVTEYFGWLLTLRAGLLEPQEMLDKVAREIALLEETAARDTISVAQASRTVWEQGYAGGGVSFYNKGFLVGLALDYEIRSSTAGGSNLDDFVRLLNDRFSGKKTGYSGQQLIEALSLTAGHDMTSFYNHYIEGTTPFDYAAILNQAGLQLQLDRQRVGWVGDLTLFGPEHRFYMIGHQTPLGLAGVQRGDALIAIGDWQLTDAEAAEAHIAALMPGLETTLLIERQGVEMKLPLQVAARDRVEAAVSFDRGETADRIQFREQWLFGIIR
jgi:predicted metalloprotease with PDZ domain